MQEYFIKNKLTIKQTSMISRKLSIFIFFLLNVANCFGGPLKIAAPLELNSHDVVDFASYAKDHNMTIEEVALIFDEIIFFKIQKKRNFTFPLGLL